MSSQRRRAPRGAVEIDRALPVKLTRRVSEHGSRRVLAAIAAELDHRSPVELAERIARNWEHWRWRLSAGEPVRHPVALAIRLTRRGTGRPDVRCEDSHQLDLDAPCKACALAAAEHAARTAPAANEPPAPQPRAVFRRRYGARARALLRARTAAERESILAAHQARAHSA